MDAIEAARKLGAAIQADERFAKFEEARKANDEDKELQDLIGNFNITRMELDKILQEGNGNPDEEKVKELNEKLRDSYTKIMMNPLMTAYNEAKMAMDELVNSVNLIIGKSLQGEDPFEIDTEAHDCSGSCSTCGGCH